QPRPPGRHVLKPSPFSPVAAPPRSHRVRVCPDIHGNGGGHIRAGGLNHARPACKRLAPAPLSRNADPVICPAWRKRMNVLEQEGRIRNRALISVLNPVGYPPKVQRKSAADRLESLEGKTVYLVDCRFDDSIELLKQVQAWFGRHMPDVKTRVVSLSNYYGKDDPRTWEDIKANGDAAILGVGHCSTCAPAVATHAITLEARYGVPTVALHTDKFDRVVRSTAKVQGLAHAPAVFVPQPVMGKSETELAAYVEGKDPLSGRPVMQEVIEGLTRAPQPPAA